MANITGDQALVKNKYFDYPRYDTSVRPCLPSESLQANRTEQGHGLQSRTGAVQSNHLVQEIGPGESSGGRKPQAAAV